jgi:RimJ/RimL family protein N-acetyltransferase
MKVLETERLVLRRLGDADAPFIVALLNDPGWLRYIGDKGVKSLDDARTYIRTGPAEMYARLGHGLYLVELKQDAVPIGLCGLIKRDILDDVDLGFAFLPQYRAQGYAREAAAAALAYARDALGLRRIVAITSPDNADSGRLLERIGFHLEGLVRLAGRNEDVRLYVSEP